MKSKTVIFTDMDGTFLDKQYNYNNTKPIVDKLTTLGSFIVFCSSKTREEIEFFRKAINNTEPFVAENGAAIFIPKHYFSFHFDCSEQDSHYSIIRLGVPYQTLREKLSKIKKKTGAKIIGFGDMTTQEVAQDTGLPLHLAKLSKNREHDEPFRIIEGNQMKVLEAIKDAGLQCIQGGGRYYHLMGNHDKGKAASILKELYRKAFGRIETFAVGDGPNDLSMLKVADKPFFIQNQSEDIRFNVWTKILQSICEEQSPLLPLNQHNHQRCNQQNYEATGPC